MLLVKAPKLFDHPLIYYSVFMISKAWRVSLPLNVVSRFDHRASSGITVHPLRGALAIRLDTSWNSSLQRGRSEARPRKKRQIETRIEDSRKSFPDCGKALTAAPWHK